jgi:hypothetical protein
MTQPVAAQGLVSGSVEGRVSDEAGRPMFGVTLTLTNRATGQRWIVRTDRGGRQPWHYNALYLDLIHHKETNIIDIYSILYEQDTDCLVQETISHLELLKSQSPEEISNYLMRQSLQFRCINQ